MARKQVSIAEATTKRRAIVASLASTGKTATQIARELNKQGVINPRSKKPYTRTTVLNDMRKVVPVKETIGQTTYVKPLWQSRILLHVDYTFKDYVFYDALRRGTAPGYEIGGLFCTPIAQTIASHAFGDGISACLMESSISDKMISVHEDGKPTKNLKNANSKGATQKKPQPPAPMTSIAKPKLSPGFDDPISYTNMQLRKFLKREQATILTTVIDSYCLGNQFLLVNPDCTLAILSPETVTVEYSASDYRRPIKYIIRTKMEKARVEDVYTAEKRVLTIQYYDDRGTQTYEFENLIGRIPIVHIANDRSANEIYGRPIYEAALPLMRRYDDLMFKTTEGVELMGNPIPVFEGLDNPGETLALNSETREYVDDLGNTQTETLLRFNREAGLFIGKGGSAKFLATPVGFTKDSLDTLRQLFLLLLNHTRIPEYLWGGAIASSKASAETQAPPFVQYIKFRRLMLEGQGSDPALSLEARGGLLELIDIFLRTYKLLNPTIVVGPVKVEWPEIDIQNDLLKFQWGSFLSSTGKISDEDTVKLAGYWDDSTAVVARAAGKDQRPPSFDDYDAKLNKAKLELLKKEQEPPDDDGPSYKTDYVWPLTDQGHQDAPFEIAGALAWEHMVR